LAGYASTGWTLDDAQRNAVEAVRNLTFDADPLHDGISPHKDRRQSHLQQKQWFEFCSHFIKNKLFRLHRDNRWSRHHTS
jgi:hypothetical protein